MKIYQRLQNNFRMGKYMNMFSRGEIKYASISYDSIIDNSVRKKDGSTLTPEEYVDWYYANFPNTKFLLQLNVPKTNVDDFVKKAYNLMKPILNNVEILALNVSPYHVKPYVFVDFMSYGIELSYAVFDYQRDVEPYEKEVKHFHCYHTYLKELKDRESLERGKIPFSVLDAQLSDMRSTPYEFIATDLPIASYYQTNSFFYFDELSGFMQKASETQNKVRFKAMAEEIGFEVGKAKGLGLKPVQVAKELLKYQEALTERREYEYSVIKNYQERIEDVETTVILKNPAMRAVNKAIDNKIENKVAIQLDAMTKDLSVRKNEFSKKVNILSDSIKYYCCDCMIKDRCKFYVKDVKGEEKHQCTLTQNFDFSEVDAVENSVKAIIALTYKQLQYNIMVDGVAFGSPSKETLNLLNQYLTTVKTLKSLDVSKAKISKSEGDTTMSYEATISQMKDLLSN